MSRPRGLRVIAGSARGRRLIAPEGDQVRPTKDIAREAMFSALGARGALDGAAVLDLYAGTGALAIEALSRGAAEAVLVERDRAAVDAIRANIEVLSDDEPIVVVAGDVTRFLASDPPAEAPFDLVFVDPPYRTPDEDVTDLLAALAAPGWLSRGRHRQRRAAAPESRGRAAGLHERLGADLRGYAFDVLVHVIVLVA